MTKEDVITWLLIFGRDWVDWRQVNLYVERANKRQWAFIEHYLEVKDDTYGNHSYRLTKKALALLDDRNEEGLGA